MDAILPIYRDIGEKIKLYTIYNRVLNIIFFSIYYTIIRKSDVHLNRSPHDHFGSFFPMLGNSEYFYIGFDFYLDISR